MIYLGIDGGGTKTAFAIIDESGRALAEHEEPTCYHIEVGMQGARDVLNRGMAHVTKKAGKSIQDLSYTFLGLPAYGEDSSLQTTLDDLPSSILPKNRYHCDNDMVTGWAAGFGGEDGINIVSGTGSISYGKYGENSARCGGWGELFSDEGSAYWIGCSGLNIFSKMSDGRIPTGPLYEIIRSELGIDDDLDLSALIHTEWHGSRGRIAQISTLVSKAAAAGDKKALAIFTDAASELADIVESTRKQLGYPENTNVPVSYSGGAFTAGEILLTPFTTTLQKFSLDYSVHRPKYTPVMGAAIYARQLFKKRS